jgi:hypothetical protein
MVDAAKIDAILDAVGKLSSRFDARIEQSNIMKLRSASELKNINKFNERVKELQKESIEKNEPMKKLTKRA